MIISLNWVYEGQGKHKHKSTLRYISFLSLSYDKFYKIEVEICFKLIIFRPKHLDASS